MTLGILLLTFGALVAAGIPLLLALTSVFAALGLLAIPSHVLPMDDAVNAVVLLIGLAVGVDYSMFYLKRAREERAAGRTECASIEAAAATVWPLGPDLGRHGDRGDVRHVHQRRRDLQQLRGGDDPRRCRVRDRLADGPACPALEARRPREQGQGAGPAEPRPARGREPFLERCGQAASCGGRCSGAAWRPPLLIAIALPALRLHTTQNSTESYPRSLKVIQAYDKIQAAFPGDAVAAEVVVEASDVRSAEVRAAIADLKRRSLATGVMFTPIEVDVNPAGTVALISVPIAGNGTNSASKSVREHAA